MVSVSSLSCSWMATSSGCGHLLYLNLIAEGWVCERGGGVGLRETESKLTSPPVTIEVLPFCISDQVQSMNINTSTLDWRVLIGIGSSS